MKFKIIILFLIFNILMLTSCNNKSSNDKIDDSNLIPTNYDNLVFIGNLFDVEHVDNEKIIYIDDNNYELIKLSNREIINDINSGKSYYIADYNHPIIKDFTPIYNDIYSFIKIISYLESEAKYYLANLTKEEVNNEILSYIRLINKNYDSNIWSIVCGRNDKLINILNDIDYGGLNISDYFASFIPNYQFNNELYKNTKDEYINNYLNLIDPLNENNYIDLIHFIGALDGIALNSGNHLNEFPYYVMDEKYYKMVLSFAGDMQTCAERLEYYDLKDISFEEILKREDLTFNMEDFIADMDAINLGINLNLSKINKLSDEFRKYFSNLKRNNNREQLFISSTLELSGYDKNDINNFKLIILEMLKLDQNYNEYNKYDNINYVKYHYLYNSNNNICDISYRRHLAKIFINYFNI